MSDSKVQFYFDKDYKIRVFDPVKFERSEEFEKACGEFVDKISGFNDKVNFLVDILETHANRIDQQKLRVSSMSLPHIPLSCPAILRQSAFVWQQKTRRSKEDGKRGPCRQ